MIEVAVKLFQTSHAKKRSKNSQSKEDSLKGNYTLGNID